MEDENKLNGGCPFGASAPKHIAASALSYGDYLNIDGLLRLQKPLTAEHDELFFIIIHQSYELWFKLVISELERARSALFGAVTHGVHAATASLERSTAIMRRLVDQIQLLDTMRPIDFLKFREKLNPASGFQSLQFREIEFICGMKEPKLLEYFRDRPREESALARRLKEPDLRQALVHLLSRGVYGVDPQSNGDPQTDSAAAQKTWTRAMTAIYAGPDSHAPVYALLERLVDFDQQLQLWRFHHLKMVERMIGIKMGTGGSSGVAYLAATLSKKAFPYLFDFRAELAL